MSFTEDLGYGLRFQPYASTPERVGMDDLSQSCFGLTDRDPPGLYDAALRFVVPVWRRCAPWATLVLVRQLKSDSHGVFERNTETIYLAAMKPGMVPQYPHNLMATIHHEIAHAVAERLPNWEQAVYDALYGADYDNGYSDAPCERVARMYEHHACIADELGGMPPAVADFVLIYSGEIARRIKECDFPSKKKPTLLSRFLSRSTIDA